MTVKELSVAADFKILTLPSDRTVEGAYIGDLLSWVMGRAKSDSAWITIMSNVNVIAVASLADVSCVIFSEGVVPSEDIIKTAEEKGINILSSPLPSYETAVKISGMI
jgi:hypothetical protein